MVVRGFSVFFGSRVWFWGGTGTAGTSEEGKRRWTWSSAQGYWTSEGKTGLVLEDLFIVVGCIGVFGVFLSFSLSHLDPVAGAKTSKVQDLLIPRS